MIIGLLELLQQSSLAVLIANSRYSAMVIQVFHILGFTLLLASIVAFNLRIHNFALRSLPLSRFAQAVSRYYSVALFVALLAGILLGLPRAVAFWGNAAFLFKLALLLPAMVLQLAVHRQAVATESPAKASIVLRSAAALSLILWFIVGAAGRAIGFIA